MIIKHLQKQSITTLLSKRKAPKLGCDPARQQDQTSQQQRLWPHPTPPPTPQNGDRREVRRPQSRDVWLSKLRNGIRCDNWSGQGYKGLQSKDCPVEAESVLSLVPRDWRQQDSPTAAVRLICEVCTGFDVLHLIATTVRPCLVSRGLLVLTVISCLRLFRARKWRRVSRAPLTFARPCVHELACVNHVVGVVEQLAIPPLCVRRQNRPSVSNRRPASVSCGYQGRRFSGLLRFRAL